MKKLLLTMVLCLVSTLAMMAQADKIVGNYFVDYGGKQSKVKIYKKGNTYEGQVYWAREDKNPDGTKKLDPKNPDKSLRNTPIDQVVIITGLKYNAEEKRWDSGKIYDPTRGMKFNLDARFEIDGVTLVLHGKVGPFYKSIKWKKI